MMTKPKQVAPLRPRSKTSRATRFIFPVLASLFLPGCALGPPVLHVTRVETVPNPNRQIEMETLWSRAKPLSVEVRPVQGSAVARRVQLRAVHNGGAISILATWPDLARSEERRVWRWDPRSRQYYLIESPTDFFSVKFCIEGAAEACMMSGAEGVYDVWQWRDGWSHVFGHAEDRSLAITRLAPELGEHSAYPMPETGVPIYFQWSDDAGRLPYRFRSRPRRFDGNTIQSIAEAEPTGSAGDVLAEGFHHEGRWNLELKRRLSTGHPDDYALEGPGPHMMAIAIGDGEGGPAHLTSDLIQLVFD